ncbi:hypothetical protein IJD44_01600 [bacterium]|nr:hypothetical protein [bacterium]
MQLVEVKNDIAKILYCPVTNHILPSDFLLIDDINQKLIAQILNIETTDDLDKNLAVLRLVLSIDKDDNLSLYNGYIPSKNAEILYVNPDEILELVKGNGDSLFFGELSNHPLCYVKTSISLINDKLYVQSDRDDKTKIIIQNLIYELNNKNKKIVLLDFDGRYSDLTGAKVLKLSEEFKFPLNSNGFDTIIEHDLDDCSLDDKAVIQSIVLELKEYLETLKEKFIPFSVFKTAVDDVFLSNPVSGLMLFRNKLWRYSQNKMFAESKDDFDIITNSIVSSSPVVIDVSELDECRYKYALQTIIDLIKSPCYMILSLDGVELDKKTIISLYKTQNIIPVVSTSFDSKYSQLLKSLCSNQLMSKPSKLYSDDDKYSSFLNKINTSSMILYGESTLYLPLIIDLKLFDVSTADEVVDNEIKKDVDKLLSSSKSMLHAENITETILNIKNENTEAEIVDDEVLDSDLDFLDEILIEEKKSQSLKYSNEKNVDDAFLQEEKIVPEVVNSVEKEDLKKNIPVENDQENKPIEDEETDINVSVDVDAEDVIPESSCEEVCDVEEKSIQENESSDEYVYDESNDENDSVEKDLSSEDYIQDEDSDDEADLDLSYVQNKKVSEIDTTKDYHEMKMDYAYKKAVEEKIGNEVEFIDEELGAESEIETIEDDIYPESVDEKEEIETVSVEIEKPEINENINTKKKTELPVYETDTSYQLGVEDLPFKVGDVVYHPKHGKGIIEGFTNYSNKILFCQIEFENVGRRILDPRIAELQKIEE